MEKLKFSESKVINALHTEKIEEGKTGVFANDVMALKRCVENRTESYFGKLRLEVGADAPFFNITPTDKKQRYFNLFYPITRKDFFGEDRTSYLEDYKLPEYKKKLSYAEYTEVMQSRHRVQKKYLFSAFGIMTDVTDGEVYNADVDFGMSYGKDHGKTDRVVLLVEAPNELLAKITAEMWFEHIAGYRRSGVNYVGCCWSESRIFRNKRYFGEFNKDLTLEEIINSIKLYDTKDNYNLTGVVKTLSFNDVINTRGFSSYLDLNDRSYSCEKEYIIDMSLVGKESLRTRVTKALKNAGLRYHPIYRAEMDFLYKDFDNTMNAIIESIKSFEALPKNLIDACNNTLKKDIKDSKSKFIRPEVFMVNGKDTNKGRIIAASYEYAAEGGYYCAIMNGNTSYITKKGLNIADLEKTSLQKDWLDYTHKEKYAFDNDVYSCLRTIVFPIEDYIIIPGKYKWGHCKADYKDKLDDMPRAKDCFIWTNVVDGISTSDLIKIESAFSDIDGIADDDETILIGHLTITNDTYDGHKCVKVHTHIENFNYNSDGSYDINRYSSKKSFKYKHYIKFLKTMYEYGYHVVKADNQKDDKGKYGNEDMDFYFAKNRNGVDYDETFTESYWIDHIKPQTKELW